MCPSIVLEECDFDHILIPEVTHFHLNEKSAGDVLCVHDVLSHLTSDDKESYLNCMEVACKFPFNKGPFVFKIGGQLVEGNLLFHSTEELLCEVDLVKGGVDYREKRK